MNLNDNHPTNGKQLKNLPEEVEEMLASIMAVRGDIYHGAVHFLFNQQNCHILWDNACGDNVDETTRGILRAISEVNTAQFIQYVTSLIFAQDGKLIGLTNEEAQKAMLEFINDLQADAKKLMKKQQEYNIIK